MENENRFNLSNEEIDELVLLYNEQKTTIQNLAIKANMFEEWAIKYKIDLEKLKLELREKENLIASLNHRMEHLQNDYKPEE